MKTLLNLYNRSDLRACLRIPRTTWLVCLAVGCSALAQTPVLTWAQNPFDSANPFDGSNPFQTGGDQPFGAAAPRAARRDDAKVIGKPMIEGIFLQDLTDPAKRLAAAETLLLTGYPEQAGKVLAEFRQPLAPEEAYAFVLKATSLRLLWIQAREDVDDAVKSWITATLKNANDYAVSEEATGLAIREILDGNASQRTAAQEKLHAVGLAAATPILTKMQELIDSRDFDSGRLRRLIQVIQTGSEEWDSTLRSLVGRSSKHEPAAILGLAARNRSPLNQATVLEWTLRDDGNLPEPNLQPVIDYWRTQVQTLNGVDLADSAQSKKWLEQLNRSMMSQWKQLRDPRYQRSQTVRRLWLYDSTVEGLIFQETDAAQELARDHALVATAWLRADGGSEESIRNFVAAQFQRAKLLQGIDEPLPEDAVQFAAQDLSAEQLSDMLRVALEDQQWLVAQCLIEALQSLGNEDLLAATASRMAPVVLALKSSDQRVRFAAAKTILSWQPSKAFAGSSYLSQTLGELLSAPLRAEAVVASKNPYHAAYLAAMTRAAGWDAAISYSAAHMIADYETYPVSFFVITDSLGEVPYATAVEQIRSAPKGQTVPILLLLRPENLTAARKLFQVERADSYMVIAEFSEEGRDLLPWFDEVARLQAVGATVPTRSAMSLAMEVLELLQPWLNSESSRKFLDMATLSRPARSLIAASPMVAKSANELLSYYGDPETQVYLAGLAGDSGMPLSVRSTAARAFRNSVQRFGTLLTSKQIESMYDRQNRSAQEDTGTQQILNSVLDTLEARFRRTPFDQLPPVPDAG